MLNDRIISAISLHSLFCSRQYDLKNESVQSIKHKVINLNLPPNQPLKEIKAITIAL
jgi:hypothetical protein